jgi:crotonobetainyl-CoA:carnitine CoA-transferase CaiB-like acyl-CoA transferase
VIVANWTKSHTVTDIVTWCTARSIACSPIREVRDLADWEQLKHRELLTTAKHPGLPGRDRLAASAFPLKFSGADTRYKSPAALHGEHTDEVLHEWLGESRQKPRGAT